MKNNLIKNFMMLLAFASPLFAITGEEEMLMTMVFGAVTVYLVVTILFLISQNSFAKEMKVKQKSLNIKSAWIWTQVIPIWSLVAIPVTLIRLNKQFIRYVEENNLQTDSSLKFYTSTWGWIWFGGSIVSIVFQPFIIVSIIGLIGFWMHINSVKKSLVLVNYGKTN